jgi:hypothetical protein
MKRIYILLFLLITIQAKAQIIYLYNGQNVPVTMNSQQKSAPWAGGFENPMLTMGDLNNDNKTDIVVFERNPKQIKTFINTGTTGNPNYTFEPKYIFNFPAFLSEYVTLADYNDDNIPDLFTNVSPYGFSAYKGYYNGNNELCFEFYTSTRYWNDPSTFPPVNVYLKNADVPCVIDIDEDGDLDFLSYDSWGAYIFYYQNMQVEAGLPPDSIRVELRDKCWGKISQGGARTHNMHYTCDNSNLLYNVGQRPANESDENGQRSAGNERDGNNAICIFRADNDGDFDLLDGNNSFPDLQFFRNGKEQNSWPVDTMTFQDTVWQNAYLQQYPSAFYLDADQDGNMDIMVTPHLEGGSNNYKNVQFFRNTGTTANPAYVFQNDSFLVNQMIDVGSNAFPMLYDYDRDGKPDLIVGSGGYFQSGALRSKLAYYRNTSTGPGSPSFNFETYNLLQLDTMTLPVPIKGSAPTAGDINGDGKDDLVLGESDGTLTFYANTAADNTVQPIWSNPVRRLRDANNVVMDAGADATPFIYDMDHDGRKDIVVGTMLGYFVYYQNIGTVPGEVKFKKVNSQLGHVKVDPQTSWIGYSTPYIGKIDDTNIDYLVSGSNSGGIYRYNGFQSGDTTVTYQEVNGVNLDVAALGVRTAPTFGDIDGDGKMDMVIGTKQGGLLMYRQSNLSAIPAPVAINDKVQVYPNPAKNVLYMTWEPGFAAGDKVEVSIINAVGQQMVNASFDAGQNAAAINISELPSGIYFCIARSGEKQKTITVSIVR